MELFHVVVVSVVAGLAASVACGLGVLPLFIRGLDPSRHAGLGYAFAGGLMVSASVYNLIWPGLTEMGTKVNQPMQLGPVFAVVAGILGGAWFLSVSDRLIARETAGHQLAAGWGGRAGLLVFLAMTVHSIPEGVAVGVGFVAQEAAEAQGLDQPVGLYLALAIAIHNVPEGLAVAIPMRSAGASLGRCFLAAFLTSLPQPVAAVPAVLAAWFFTPLMPVLMGFAAGAMVFLVVLELIPDALETEKPRRIAWGFVAGFCLMLVVQVLL